MFGNSYQLSKLGSLSSSSLDTNNRWKHLNLRPSSACPNITGNQEQLPKLKIKYQMTFSFVIQLPEGKEYTDNDLKVKQYAEHVKQTSKSIKTVNFLFPISSLHRKSSTKTRNSQQLKLLFCTELKPDLSSPDLLVGLDWEAGGG